MVFFIEFSYNSTIIKYMKFLQKKDKNFKIVLKKDKIYISYLKSNQYTSTNVSYQNYNTVFSYKKKLY